MTPVAMATKFGTKSAISRLVYDMSRRSLRPAGVFGVTLSSDVKQILTGPTQVDMGTKFEIKLSITRLVYEISPRSLRPTWGFQGRAIE